MLALNGKDTGGVTGSSATRWEPGSARVPTFCAVPLGKASGDGDLPLDGDEGGEPKRESMRKARKSISTRTYEFMHMSLMRAY